ncbi:phage tail domain-containing protein [Anaerovorax sp. IOR16]|uniref:phage tail domain-containing protein n=1 Tax=Anaerovorax sp. IOR16 TaxID=2773458 RepID=UPI0019CF880A|nr:phage tail domain-containing protein [Anaerovorax sp. IOR16]
MITNIILENVELNKKIEIGNDRIGYVLGLVDFGQAPAVQNTTNYINLVGAQVMSTRLESRSINIKGAIFDVGLSVSDKKRELNRIVNPNHTLAIQYKKYKIYAKANSSIAYATERIKNGKNFCEFLIQCTAFDPVFRRIKEEVVCNSNIGPISLFPLQIPSSKGICFGKLAKISVANVPNDGDVDAGFVIRFIAEEGDVINPTITNNKTGDSIQIIANMAQGDIIEVSTVPGNKYAKYIRGKSEVDIFKILQRVLL